MVERLVHSRVAMFFSHTWLFFIHNSIAASNNLKLDGILPCTGDLQLEFGNFQNLISVPNNYSKVSLVENAISSGCQVESHCYLSKWLLNLMKLGRITLHIL